MAIDLIMYPDPPACSVEAIMYPDNDGGYSGQIGMAIAGGTAPYTFSVTLNGVPFTTQVPQYISPNHYVLYFLSGGTYVITVTDSLGNTTSSTTTLVNPSSISDNATITPATCNGGNGTIALNPSGGTPFGGAPPNYLFLWSTGATTESITQPAGTYSVTITDANDCNFTFTYVIPVTPPVILEIEQENINGVIVLTAEFSCAGGTVLWSTGETTTTIEAEPNTTYSVTLTCGNGCTQTASISTSDADDSYWCCLSGIINSRIVDELNGVNPCDCNDDIMLMCLIPIFQTINDGCLTAVQQTSIISKLNSICNCDY